MEKTEIGRFKKKIEDEVKKVEQELRSVGRTNPSNPKDWEATPDAMDILAADQNEVADSIESYEENTGILKQLEIRYNELAQALKRIEDGSYGTCEADGKPIERARLEANPAARTCIAHAK